ncbi:MAG: trypsin-like peptidase domain-containing protein [bacterium]|nr:trypsin-like peptidase domain-containing protein [bacterium]
MTEKNSEQHQGRHDLTSELVAHESRGKQHLISNVAIGLIFGLVGGVLGSSFIAPWYQREILGENPGSNLVENRKIIVDEESAVISAVEKVNAAVVSIVVTKDLPKLEQFGFPFDEFFYPPPSGELEKQEIGAGSGFIVTSDGMIVTNRHVVSDTEAEYTVVTADNVKYPAKVLATDPFNDLAVIKIDAQDLPIAQMGDSTQLKLGQRVIAIGNALGEFQNTVTTGVVSGIGRTITAGGGAQTEKLSEVIQTDAAINPGNSGGPLINLSGEVIGVNTAVSQQAQLIGFAIPSSQAKKVIDDVKEFGHVRRAFLGVRYLIITVEYATSNNLPVDYGALIIKGDTLSEPAIVAGSPADDASLKEGDIILEVEGEKIDPDNQLGEILRGFDPGDRVILKVLVGGSEKVIPVTLGEAQ